MILKNDCIKKRGEWGGGEERPAENKPLQLIAIISSMLTYDLEYTIWHTIYQYLEDIIINIIPGLNDGDHHFCHTLKLSSIGIESSTEDTRCLFLGIDMKVQDRHNYLETTPWRILQRFWGRFLAEKSNLALQFSLPLEINGSLSIFDNFN